MVRKFRNWASGLTKLRKFIYLISPNKIYDNFYLDLEKVLSANNVKFFQLRLKNTKKTRIIEIAKKIKKITKKYKVKFLINDSFKIAKIVNADGFHLGQKDGSLIKIKKNFKNKILGVTCHSSKILAKTNQAICWWTHERWTADPRWWESNRWIAAFMASGQNPKSNSKPCGGCI